LAGSALFTLSRAQAQPRLGGTLTVLLPAAPSGFVPGIATDAPALFVGSKIYQGLVTFSPALEPLPELARSWSVSSDGRTTIFKLRPGVTWHDGRPFTSDDVLFSVTRFAMEQPTRAKDVFSRIKAASAPDPETVLLTLDRPFQPFLLMFDVTACPIVSRHLWADAPNDAPPIGTGPFRWDPAAPLRLRRNEHYWKPGQPYLDEIICRVMPGSAARAAALEAGEAQLVTELDPADAARLREVPSLEVTTAAAPYFSPLLSLVLNHRVASLADVRVRQAISLAVDREYIRKQVWHGMGVLATGPVASTTRFYDPGLGPLPRDPRRAAGLLTEAGLRPNGQGVRLTLRHLVDPGDPLGASLAGILRASMRQVGIDLILDTAIAGEYARRLADGAYETVAVTRNQYGDPSLGVAQDYIGEDAASGFYRQDRVTQLFADAAAAEEPPSRRAALAAVQRLLLAGTPRVWLLEVPQPVAHDRRLGPGIDGGTGLYGSFDTVRLG